VIYDRFPVVELAVDNAVRAVGNGVAYTAGLVGRGLDSMRAGRGGDGYQYGGDLDPLLDAGGNGSPSFTASMPPPERGVYSPLPARAPQGP